MYDKAGNSPLSLACAHGMVDMAMFLLQKGAAVRPADGIWSDQLEIPDELLQSTLVRIQREEERVGESSMHVRVPYIMDAKRRRAFQDIDE